MMKMKSASEYALIPKRILNLQCHQIIRFHI